MWTQGKFRFLAADRTGNLSDLANSLTGAVTGQYWASLLSQELPYAVSAGEAYYTPGCSSSAQCVFPHGVIPVSAWSAPARNLLRYIPPPNGGTHTFSTTAKDERLRDDKGASRLDDNTPWGLLTAYYFADDIPLNDPYPVAQSGASVPGFDALYLGRAQLLAWATRKPWGRRQLMNFTSASCGSTIFWGNPSVDWASAWSRRGF